MSTSVASVVSFFPDSENGFSTTTSGSVSSGAATVGLNSVAGYTNGLPAVFVIDPSNSKKQTFTGIIDTSGVQVTSVVWTAGSNVAHDAGATVVDYATATHIAMISKGATVEHAQAGTHTNITQADANYIKDDAGNELVKWSKTASAVNEVTIKNAATATDPRISASGGDSNVNLNLRGKGLAKTVTIGAGAATIFPYDYVTSSTPATLPGCVWTADNVGVNLNASMTAGVVVINGNPVTVALVTARAFTTNVDTYIDVLDNGDGTGLLVYTTAATNAASPALAANSVRIGIIQAAATITATTKVNQGQENKVFPIASSVPYAVTDSLGNLICPRDPGRHVLGMRQIITTFSTASTSAAIVTGLSVPVIIPTGRKVKVGIVTPGLYNDTAGKAAYFEIYEGATLNALTTKLGRAAGVAGGGTFVENGAYGERLYTPTSTSLFYSASLRANNSGTAFVDVLDNTEPAYIKVELV